VGRDFPQHSFRTCGASGRRPIGSALFEAIDLRLRPDLGPTPELARGAIPRNLVLYGPPGTGKTFVARQVAQALTGQEEPGEESRWRLVQFHPSYAYEDFVQGLRPDLEQASLRYRIQKGPFLQVCEAAADEPDSFHVLVIDEINRGDPARIFGELLYGLEYRGESVDLAAGGQLTVPPNLVIVGTMNSVDRSVALVDYALRRRFAFVRVEPSPEVVTAVRSKSRLAPVAAAVLGAFNGWITERLDREHAIGHSFFLNPALGLDEVGALDRVWSLDVLPLLEEYFFGDRDSLAEAERQWKAAVSDAVAELEERDADDSAQG